MSAKQVLLGGVLSLCLCFGACARQKSDSGSNVSGGSATAPLFEDLGSYHHAVTTTNELAQKYFDQGLRLVYGFNHDEAERAFREAARLDRDCAMAWWGVAYTLGPNYNLPMDPARNQKAVEAIQNAQSLLVRVSEPERAYIDALATRYSADPKSDRATLDRTYGDAMKALYLRYPQDNDAAVLYAESLMDLKPWQLWTHDGKPQPGTEDILRVLEAVLARDPNHPGANHYYIHAVEASPDPQKGLASAERLQKLVPGAGHLVHMPAHIFIRTGNFEGAIEANANAARADEAYFAKTKVDGVYPMMYYTHNFMFLSAAAGMAGRSKESIESAAKAVSLVAPMAGNDPLAEYVLPWGLYAMTRSGRWDDILATARPADSTPATLVFWHYARAQAQIARGKLSEARKEQSDLDLAEAKVPVDFLLNTNRAHDLFSIAAAVLNARLKSRSGDGSGAIRDWMKAVELQDRLIYDEPPAWYYPVRESLGGEYLRAGKYGDAEKVFRRDLEINPGNPRSLLGLREALRAQSKTAEAEEISGRFEKGWAKADIQIAADSL